MKEKPDATTTEGCLWRDARVGDFARRLWQLERRAGDSRGDPLQEHRDRRKDDTGALHVCRARHTSPLEWGVVPKNTGELALFVVGYVPEPATKTYALSIEWAVAGLSPTLHRLTTERLPFGAFAGVATGGKRTYSICPKRGVSEHYQFLLFAVPSTSAISPRFAGLPVLSALTKPNAGTSAAAEGAFEVIYKRL